MPFEGLIVIIYTCYRFLFLFTFFFFLSSLSLLVSPGNDVTRRMMYMLET